MDSGERRPLLLAQIRGSITALAQLQPTDPEWTAHLTLALTAIARRVDELEHHRDVEELPTIDPPARRSSPDPPNPEWREPL